MILNPGPPQCLPAARLPCSPRASRGASKGLPSNIQRRPSNVPMRFVRPVRFVGTLFPSIPFVYRGLRTLSRKRSACNPFGINRFRTSCPCNGGVASVCLFYGSPVTNHQSREFSTIYELRQAFHPSSTLFVFMHLRTAQFASPFF